MKAEAKRVGDLLVPVGKQQSVKRSAYADRGRYPVIDQSQDFVAGYCDDPACIYTGSLPVVVFGDHTRCLKYVEFPFCVGADGTQLLRPHPSIDIRFFYYALCNLRIPHYGYERHFKYLKDESIAVPDLMTQRMIASVLSAYDELIGNNSRRIAICEQIAESLYREWFVELRFPGHGKSRAIDSTRRVFPEGWRVVSVKGLVERIKAGRHYTQQDVSESGEVPVIDQSSAEVLGFHCNEADLDASPEAPIIVFGDHTCKMELVVTPFSIGPNVVPFRSQAGIPVHYLYWLVKSLVKTSEYKRHWSELIGKEVLLGASPIPSQFAEAISPLVAAMTMHRRHNRALRATRDLLLPKLMSGQLDVEDLDIDIGESLAEADA